MRRELGMDGRDIADAAMWVVEAQLHHIHDRTGGALSQFTTNGPPAEATAPTVSDVGPDWYRPFPSSFAMAVMRSVQRARRARL
jgi:hypothetical protein